MPDTAKKVARRRASVLVVHEGRILAVRLTDPLTKIERCFLPGGALETGETAATAAERECFEETGLAVRAEPSSEKVSTYDFEWNGVIYVCSTSWFCGTLLSSPENSAQLLKQSYHEAGVGYHTGTLWVPVAEKQSVFGFRQEFLQVIEELLQWRQGE